MVSTSSILPAIMSHTPKADKLKKLAKGAGLGGAATGAFCLLDFVNVPGAFKLEYNSDGEKVEGTNWKSGLKELGKSTAKCVGYLAVPALLTGMAAGAPLTIAAILGAASFGSAFALSSLFEKLLPEEQKVVAEACAKKGITLNQEA